MTSRKPLQGKNVNRRERTIMQSSDTSTKHLSQYSNTLRRFQLPSHKTNPSDTSSIKNQPIQQSITRTSRLNRPKTTKCTSEKVISAKSWQTQDQQLHRQEEEKNLLQQEQQQQQQQQENGLVSRVLQMSATQHETMEQPYFYRPKKPSQIQDHPPPLDIIAIHQLEESHEQSRQNIEWNQGDERLFFSATCPETTTSISLKRQYLEFDQQERLTTDDYQQNLQLLSKRFTFSSSVSSISTSPPPKRHHGSEPHSPSIPLDDSENQPNVHPIKTPFDFNTTSTRNRHTSPPSTLSRSQTPPSDTENQQEQCQPLLPLTKFQLFTQSSSSSSSHTHNEIEKLRDTTSNAQPHFDNTAEIEGMTPPTLILSHPWTNSSHDLSEIQQEHNLSSPPVAHVQKSPQHSHIPLSPVYNLNNDCLTEILKWCASMETLYQVSLVCKHWRNVALQPYVWRTVNYTWDSLVQQLEPSLSAKGRGWCLRTNTATNNNNNNNNDSNNNSSSNSVLSLLISPFIHIRTITLDNSQNSTRRLCGLPTTSIFTNLCNLHLTTMHFKDILDLVTWTVHLKELNCINILTADSNDMVMITPFTNLRRLQILKLHFTFMSELIGPTSLSAGIMDDTGQITNNRWHFSPTLRILKITNTYDIEEYLTCSNSEPQLSIPNAQQQHQLQQQQQRQHVNMTEERLNKMVQSWNAMENTLMHKYRVFQSLEYLTCLSLGYCTGYTARIWRECVAPATRHLKKLTLCGWSGDGRRESPLAWKERLDMALMTNTSIDMYMEDVEKALAEMLAGLYHLESLTLIQFKCTTGVVMGMERLTQTNITGKSYSHKSLQAIMNNNSSNNDNDHSSSPIITSETTDLPSFKDLLNWHLIKCKLKFSTTLPFPFPPPSQIS